MTKEEKCLDTIERALNGTLWLANNDHLIGDLTFKQFFDAAVVDVRLAKTALQELRSHP